MISIDLGSNSLRMIKYDCYKKEFTTEYEKIVKTAELLHSEGIIAPSSIQRILDAFKEASKYFNFKNETCVTVATEAMRRASNSNEAIEKIYQETGVKFKIIGAKQEAELTLLAVDKRLEELGFRGSFLLIDIGGGSTEIIFKKGNLVESKSFPVGIVTMASKYPSRQELEEGIKKELQEIKAYIDEYYAKVGQPDFFVATAGVPTTIAAFLQGMSYDSYDKKRINGFNVNFFGCEKALKELLELSFEERAKYVGVGREDLIISGIMIYASFFRLFDFETSVIIDDGLREGLAIKSCSKYK